MGFAIIAYGMDLGIAANCAGACSGEAILALLPVSVVFVAIRANYMSVCGGANGAGPLITAAVRRYGPLAAGGIIAIGAGDMLLQVAADTASAFVVGAVSGKGPLAVMGILAIGAGSMGLQIAADAAGTLVVQAISSKGPLAVMGFLAIDTSGMSLQVTADGTCPLIIDAVGGLQPLAVVFFLAIGAGNMGLQTVADPAKSLVGIAILGQRPLVAGGIIAAFIDHMDHILAADGAGGGVGQGLHIHDPLPCRSGAAIAADHMVFRQFAIRTVAGQGSTVLGQRPFGEAVLTERRINVNVAAQELPCIIRQQQIANQAIKQICLGIRIPPTGVIAILLEHGIQIGGQRIQTPGGFHDGKIGIHTSGVILLVDGIAIFVIGIPSHFSLGQQFDDGDAETLAQQVDQNDGAILIVQVVEAFGIHIILDRAHEVGVLDLGITRQMGCVRCFGQFRCHGIFVHDAIRQAEHRQNGVADIIGCINGNYIGHTHFRNFQREHIVLNTGSIGCGLGGGLPVFDGSAQFVGVDLVCARLGGLEQEIGQAQRLHFHIDIAHLDIVSIKGGTGGGGFDLSGFTGNAGGHRNGGGGHFSGQLKAGILIIHIALLEQQFDRVVAADQCCSGHAVSRDSHSGLRAVGCIEANHNIGVGIAVTVQNGDRIGNLCGALIIFQNDGHIRPNAEVILIFLGNITLRRNNGGYIVAGRQGKYHIAVLVGNGKTSAYGDRGAGYGQTVVVLHMNGICDLLLFVQTNHNFLRSLVRGQQILGRVSGESLREHHLDQITAGRQHGGQRTVFVGNQYHRLAIDRESGGDAGHRQAFHVFKS